MQLTQVKSSGFDVNSTCGTSFRAIAPMPLIRVALLGWVGLLSGCFAAAAQNPRDFINLFGGLVQNAIVQAALEEWKLVPEYQLSCIESNLQQQGSSLHQLIGQGIKPSDPRVAGIRSACPSFRSVDISRPFPSRLYAVDGLELYGRVVFGSPAYQQYQCSPSEFAGLTRCARRSVIRSGGREAEKSNSLLHRSDGTALYVNVSIEPAFFTSSEITSEIERLSSRFKQPARVLRMPSGASSIQSVIASWGELQLRSLDADSLRVLAAGGRLSKGVLIDFLGDFTRSAREGLPVFQLHGGAGYVWAASYDSNGQGRLRFLTFDAAAISSYPAAMAGNSTVTNDGNPQAASVERFDKLKLKASKGDAKAQFEIGQMYLEGVGTSPNGTEAAAWFMKSATQGYAPAETIVGKGLLSGTDQDKAEAAGWFRKAAEQGNAEAQYQLALLLESGDGLTKDDTQANIWLQKAAKQGYAPASARIAAAAASLAKIRTVTKQISEQRDGFPENASKQELDALAAQLLAANEATAPHDLKPLEVRADAAVRLLDDERDRKLMVKLADSKVAFVTEKLARITSDAPLVQEIQSAIAAVKAAQSSMDGKSLKVALDKLNRLYDNNRAALDDMEFATP